MKIEITYKAIRRGNCRIQGGEFQITIPTWVWKYADAYETYYICHELAHAMCYQLHLTMAHTAAFHEIEDRLMADFGVRIKRAKAYACEIFEFGVSVWRKHD